MIAEYLSLLLLWSSIVFTNLEFPDLSFVFSVGTLSNLSIPTVRLGTAYGTINASHWYLESTTSSEAFCRFDFLAMGTNYEITSVIRMKPARILLNKSVDDMCEEGSCYKSEVEQCDVSLSISDIKFKPFSYMFKIGLALFSGTINKNLKSLVCDTGLSYITRELRNRTVNAPLPPPHIVPGATPLEDIVFVRALVNILNHIPGFFGVHTNASLLAGTTLRVGVDFRDGLQFTLSDLAKLQSFLPRLKKFINVTALDNIFKGGLKLFPGIEGLQLRLSAPPFKMSAEVSFYDLQCDRNGVNCSVPSAGGILVQNIRVENLEEWDRLITNHIGPLAIAQLNEIIQNFMEVVKGDNDRVVIPMPKEANYELTPPIAAVICTALVSVFLLVGTVFLGIWHHKREVVTTSNGTPISLMRVLLEDITLVMMVIIATVGFVWSNTTSVSSLVLGDEFYWVDFTLYESIRNIYDAGSFIFPLLVFIFGGVYPYIKLLAILVCTLILRKPDLVILKLINYFGKFSLIDSFALLLMLGGLQLEGVGKVRVLPGFYYFLASTILSIIVGNYATGLWRRNTSIRQNFKAQESSASDTTEVAEVLEEERKDGKLSKRIWKRDLALRVLHAVLILACILPVWVVPCIQFSVTGMASAFQPVDREMSLWELSYNDWPFLLTCIVTTAIAPFFYVVMYPRCSLLSSWSAADALLVTCIAGITQLPKFVKYAVGEDLQDVYGVSTRLLWPLIPLLFSAVWQWVLVVEHNFGIRQRVIQWLRNRKATPPTPLSC